MTQQKKKVAILLRGGVGKVCGQLLYAGDIYKPAPYINYHVSKNCLDRHIIAANPNYDFDIFLHCWSHDLYEPLLDLYKPTAYWFEDNNKYHQMINNAILEPQSFACASQTLSTSHGCRVIDMHQQYINQTYDMVILYRYDILLWKDMNLDALDMNHVYINNWENTIYGDLHVIFHGSLVGEFSKLFYMLGPNNPAREHGVFPNFIQNHLKKEIRPDNIIVAKDQNLIRRIGISLNWGHVTEEQLLSYGLTMAEVQTYRDI